MPKKRLFCCANIRRSTLIVGWLSLIYTITLSLLATGAMIYNDMLKQDARNTNETDTNYLNDSVAENNYQNASVEGNNHQNPILGNNPQVAIVASNYPEDALVTSNNPHNTMVASNSQHNASKEHQNVSVASNNQYNHRQRIVFDWDKYIFLLLITFLYVSITICLLYGTYKGRPGFLMPYMVFSGLKVEISFFTVICVLVFELVHYKGEMRLVTLIAQLIALFYIALSVSFCCIVSAHYGELQSTKTVHRNTSHRSEILPDQV